MFKNKNIGLLLLSLVIWLCYAKNPDKDIVIVYTNDVHCAVEDNIGYAGLTSYREKMKESAYVSLVDAGDSIQGATIGSIAKGEYIIEIMNSIEYDIAIPGNHEFDYGMDQFLKLADSLSCGYLSCNFRNLTTGDLIFEPYRMLTYGDVKVAYVGISTPESIVKSTPTYFMDADGNFVYDFDGDDTGENLVKSVQKAVDEARAAGADYVIAIGHLGEFNDITPVWAAPFVVEHTKGIDAFIDGHSHEVTPSLLQKNAEGKAIPITQSGTKLAYVGQVTIKTDGTITTELIAPEGIPAKDQRISGKIEEVKARYEDSLKEVIGHTRFALEVYDEEGAWLARRQETSLGNLITDGYLREAEKYGGADISFVNGGSIRTRMPEGDLTINDVLNTLPFNNEICIVTMSGQTLLDALEMGARKYPEPSGGFLQTAGITYAIDPTIESTVEVDDKAIFVAIHGERRVHQVKVHGQPIDPERRYTVISDAYLLTKNGDGYVFPDLTMVKYNFALPSGVFENYVRALKEIPEHYRMPEGRITVTPKGGKEEDGQATTTTTTRTSTKTTTKTTTTVNPTTTTKTTTKTTTTVNPTTTTKTTTKTTTTVNPTTTTKTTTRTKTRTTTTTTTTKKPKSKKKSTTVLRTKKTTKMIKKKTKTKVVTKKITKKVKENPSRRHH